MASLSLVHGGYFPTAWGWGSLAFLWVGLLALIFADNISLGAFEYTLLGAFGAFLAWSATSMLWSVAPQAAIREVERGILVFSALLTAMLLAKRRTSTLLGGVMAGIMVAAIYGLATRLFPARLGSFDAIAGYRLAEPLGYWNALGLMASMGILLGLSFAARAHSLLVRAASSASPVFLFPVLYFTYGRGAWFALAIGFVFAVALDRRRLQLITVALTIAPFAGFAVWACTRQPSLNRRAAALAEASSEGRHLVLVLFALAAGAGLTGAIFFFIERAIVVQPWARLAYGSALALSLAAIIAVVIVHYGSPQAVATQAYRSFNAPPIGVGSSGNLSERLFSLSNDGRLAQWRVAVDDYDSHPFLGSGSGTYEYAWLKNRPRPGKVRDAHNLYLEVLAELGPGGLGLLGAMLAVPIFAAIKVRRQPFVPIALGTYVAFMAHAAVDWDWEMPALTIAGLLCGVAILAAVRPDVSVRVTSRRPARIASMTAVAALGAFAFVGLMGNRAIAASNSAAAALKWHDSARNAEDAKRWMPWSSEPWRLQGEAQYVLHQDAAARANFRKAVAKDPNNWLVWADLATVSPHGAWRAPARRSLELNPLAPELGDFRQALGMKG